MMEELRVVAVVKDWDMRSKHALREGVQARALRPGTVLVAFNRRRDMVRIIDSEGFVHDGYADVGEEFNLDIVAQRMKRAWKIELNVGQHETDLRLVA